jgi:hypothetical protein
MRRSVEAAVKNRITEYGSGWCFTPMHFSVFVIGLSTGSTI